MNFNFYCQLKNLFIKKYKIKLSKSNGFTITELLIVLSLFMVLSSLTSLSLINILQKNSINLTLNNLESDLKLQQSKSMSALNNLNHGIYFDDNSYVLFSGSTYNENDSNNLRVTNNSLVSYTINNETSYILFQKYTGEIINFNENLNIQVTNGQQLKNITFNKFGVSNIND